MSLAAFEADVTPPVGSPLFTGPARSIVDRLLAKGLVVTGAGQPVVILSMDWCEIRNNSYDLWRDRIAAAAGTRRERVMLSCVHPHDAPYTDAYAQQLLSRHQVPDQLCDVAFETEAIANVVAAVRAAKPRRITHLGTGQARVREVASNRRYVLPDGKISFGRTSATRDAAIRAMPEGLVDPYLKTISFWQGETPLAALSSYSTHPMSYYGQGDVTCDFPGLARNLRQAQAPGVFQIYCSGASGDTMAGKYNDGNHANRAILRDRMLAAMEAAWADTVRVPVGPAQFRNAKLVFRPRDTEGFRIADMERIVADGKEPRRRRFDAALGLSWRARLKEKRPIDVPCLDFGSTCLLLLPAETFVQYQLWAQQEREKDFVVTLGYGESAPGYIPTRENVEEGYDDHYSWVDLRAAESALREAIRAALKR